MLSAARRRAAPNKFSPPNVKSRRPLKDRGPGPCISYVGQDRPTKTVREWTTLAWAAHFQSVRLARLAGLGIRTLRRRFRRQFHTTPQRWLEKLRLRLAETLLLKPDARTKEVAARLHYKQASHFCRLFQQSHGRSPLAWRRWKRRGPRKAPRASHG
jgi:AraC-like DNA-binding protein